MSLRVQARRASEVDPEELVYIGEMFYDDVNKRFGVFTNEDATTIRWLPRWVDDLLVLNADQMLTGLTQEGDKNNVVLDFTSPDSVKFKNYETNEIYMELTPNGAVFLTANDAIASVAGTSNLAVNGNLSITRSVGGQNSYTTGIDGNRFMFAPNWYLYAYPSSSGTLTTTFETTDTITRDVTFERVLKVTASGNNSECGVRSFFFDYKFVQDRFVTVTLRIKGPIGAKTRSRVVSEASSNLASKEIEGNGEWQTISYSCYIPPSSSTWWAVDSLYEPGKESSFLTEWLVGGLQVNLGTTRGVLERRAKNVEQALVDTLYSEGRLKIYNSDEVYPVTTHTILEAPSRISVFGHTDGTVDVTDVGRSGFNIAINNTASTNFIIKYAAFLAPFPAPDA